MISPINSATEASSESFTMNSPLYRCRSDCCGTQIGASRPGPGLNESGATNGECVNRGAGTPAHVPGARSAGAGDPAALPANGAPPLKGRHATTTQGTWGR